MIDSLSNRAGTPVIWGKSSKAQGTAKTAKSAMTDGFIERIKSYAKEDAKRGEYMSAGFTQMRLSHMKQYVSPDRSGPKNQVMSAIQAALKEPHPRRYMLLTARISQATTALAEAGRVYRLKKNINSLTKQLLFTYRHFGKLARK